MLVRSHIALGCALLGSLVFGCSESSDSGSSGGAGGGGGGSGGSGASGASGGSGATSGSGGDAGDGGTGATGGSAGTGGGGSGGDAGSGGGSGGAGSGGDGGSGGDAGSGGAGDPPPGAYGTRAPMLEPNSEMAVAAVDHRVFVLGGYPSSRETQDTLQIYDTLTDSWTLGEPYPVPIHHPVTVGLGGKLYSLGGQPDTDLVYEYDPGADAWRALSPMPTARGGGAGAAIDDKIYVVGGRPPAANAFEVYDVSDDAWVELAPLPAAYPQRNHLAAAAIGGKIYVAGGRYNGGSFTDPRTDSFDVFDPATGAWTQKAPMLRERGGNAGVAAFGCFFVYGGEGENIGEPNDVYPDHDVYNPVTDTWTALPPLPIPFHGVTGGAFVDGLLYMPGGGTSSGGSSGSTMHQVYRPALRCD